MSADYVSLPTAAILIIGFVASIGLLTYVEVKAKKLLQQMRPIKK